MNNTLSAIQKDFSQAACQPKARHTICVFTRYDKLDVLYFGVLALDMIFDAIFM